MTEQAIVKCQPLIRGDASGELLVSTVGLSFWGGVDPVTGRVIDQHHPLFGHNLCGKVVAIPSGRGSCSGSGAILEALLNRVAPAALLFSEREDILTLGVLAGQVLFERAIPVYSISRTDFDLLPSGVTVSIQNDCLCVNPPAAQGAIEIDNCFFHSNRVHEEKRREPSLQLSELDNRLLAGSEGKAAQMAMQIVIHMAELQGATELIDVTQAHIDACVYHGPSSLMFAERLASLGGKVKVPTTLNALSVDKRRWQQQGVDSEFGRAASALGDAYMSMGATLSYTCAPYLLDTAPAFGEQVVWAESNAVTFANSIIGARTQKYPDFLDICIALTGRAPFAGAHTDSGRLPTVRIHIDLSRIDLAYIASTNNAPIKYAPTNNAPTHIDYAPTNNAPMHIDLAHKEMQGSDTRITNDVDSDGVAVDCPILTALPDDSFWPLLGYHIGSVCSNDVPLITGLEQLSPNRDDHKAFSAAFATTSSVPIYHIAGHTPEFEAAVESLATQPANEVIDVNANDLGQSWNELNSATSSQVNLVCLGNPHFSLTECVTLASLCAGRTRHSSVDIIVTLGRNTYEQAKQSGYVDALTQFGVQFINDTCWCMIEEPIIPPAAQVLMTNSGKYAHYGPGLVGRQIHFGGLNDCVNAACTGVRERALPAWLGRSE